MYKKHKEEANHLFLRCTMAWEMCLRNTPHTPQKKKKKKKNLSLGLSNPTKNPTGPGSIVAWSDYSNDWQVGCESPPPKIQKTWTNLLYQPYLARFARFGEISARFNEISVGFGEILLDFRLYDANWIDRHLLKAWYANLINLSS